MKQFLAMAVLVTLTGLLAAAPASAKKQYSKVKGHVVKVEQQVRTANGGEYDRLTIRTRNGEELQLHLGRGGACEGCFQAGDQIRARVQSTDGSGGPRGIQSMRVRRDGQMHGYTNAGGRMVQDSSRGRAGAGGGDRVRDRVHEPGSAGCSGCGSGQRVGGGQRSGGGGGGHGGGGRGGN